MTQDPPIGQSGEIYYPGAEVITRFSEGTTVAGLAVIAGTAERDAKVPAATFTNKFLGIVHYDDTHETNSYANKEQMGVVHRGYVLVSYEVDTDPTPDTPAFVRHTANGAGKLTLGAIRANADTSNAVAAPGAMFRKVFASEKKAVVELTGQI